MADSAEITEFWQVTHSYASHIPATDGTVHCEGKWRSAQEKSYRLCHNSPPFTTVHFLVLTPSY
jgi:hypothetical protein